MSLKEFKELLHEEALFYRRHPELILCWVAYYGWFLYGILWESKP